MRSWTEEEPGGRKQLSAATETTEAGQPLRQAVGSDRWPLCPSLSLYRALLCPVVPTKLSSLFTVRDENRSTAEKSPHFDFALFNTRRVCYLTCLWWCLSSPTLQKQRLHCTFRTGLYLQKNEQKVQWVPIYSLSSPVSYLTITISNIIICIVGNGSRESTLQLNFNPVPYY